MALESCSAELITIQPTGTFSFRMHFNLFRRNQIFQSLYFSSIQNLTEKPTTKIVQFYFHQPAGLLLWIIIIILRAPDLNFYQIVLLFLWLWHAISKDPVLDNMLLFYVLNIYGKENKVNIHFPVWSIRTTNHIYKVSLAFTS